MAAKTFATYLSELAEATGLGAGDKVPVLESSDVKYIAGDDFGVGTITALTGDVTASGSGSVAATIAADAVTNAKLANVATQTIKGRTTAGTGDPEDLTATQATAILNTMVGDAGAGGTKGLVPAPAAGDAAAGKFLKADGTWATAGGGASYLVYTALLTQSGTDAPVATVLENTLGGAVVWTYDSQGYYIGTLAGAFTANKTALSIQNNTSISNNYSIAWVDANSVGIESGDLSPSNQDDRLTGTFVEIRVYP